jgi:hypothetical protein
LAEVVYADPVAASDCICPGLQLERTDGPSSGTSFSMGTTQVCYMAKDACGQEKPCCFKVHVQEENACDQKVSACMKYQLLSITSDQEKNHTYRIQVTNNCSNKLIYTAIQIPDGMVPLYPENNLTYTAAEGRKYLVRSPNYSPMYSVRFKSLTDSIANGQSDVFEYTLPAQADVDYINLASRLENNVFIEAHLNTFYCPVGVTPQNARPAISREVSKTEESPSVLFMFPNPTKGVFFADLSDWEGQKLQLQVTNAQGQKVHSLATTGQEDLLRVDMPQGAPSGVYFLEVATEKGKKEVQRFVLNR